MATNAINFFQPGTDAAVEQQQIDRQRKMAELLMQKSQTPAQGQMVSGHYIAPSWISGVTQALQGVGANLANKRADEKQIAMGQALRAKNADEVKSFMGALSGTPAQQIQPLTPNDDEGNPMPVAQRDAVAPDRNRALALAMQSQNPMLQNYGGKLIDQQMNEETVRAGLTAAGLPPPGAPGAASSGAPGGMPGGAPAPGGIPGVSPQAMALILNQNPQLQKLGGVIQDASKPINVTEGGTLFNPQTRSPMFTAPKTEAGIGINGGVASPVPGFQEAQARREFLVQQARQGVESANTPVTVELPNGPRRMTRAQEIEMLRGGQPAAPVAGPNALPPAQPGVTGNFQGDPQAIIAAIADIRDPQERANATAAFESQMRAAGNANGPLVGNAPTGGPGIAVQGEAAKQYDTARAKDFAGRAAEVQKGGMNASSMLRNFDTLEGLYKDPNVSSGAAAESISNLKNLASSFGVETKGLGAEQAVQAITNKMALDLRSTADGGGMPGAMSDADRNFLKGLTPDLVKSPEGRALIIDAGRKAAQRQLEVARMATDYERQNGRLDIGFDRALQDYTAANSLYGNARMPKTNAPAPAAPMDFRAAAAAELARRQKEGK